MDDFLPVDGRPNDSVRIGLNVAGGRGEEELSEGVDIDAFMIGNMCKLTSMTCPSVRCCFICVKAMSLFVN